MSRKLLMLLGVLGAICIALAVFPWTVTSNCGGNSAALSAVRSYATRAVVAMMESPDHTFRVTAATPDEQDQLRQLPGARWVPRAHFLVSTTPVTLEPRRAIIVCDTPYTNVPQHRFADAPPSHAVGFSDGSAELISPTKFAALDRSSFVSLDELFPPSSK